MKNDDMPDELPRRRRIIDRYRDPEATAAYLEGPVDTRRDLAFMDHEDARYNLPRASPHFEE